MVPRRILGPVYDNEKENWRILTNKEIDAMVKKPTITEPIRLNRLLVWTCTENGRKQNSPQKYYTRIWRQQG
jgi:histone deacetylase complex regulatory component SIN3